MNIIIAGAEHARSISEIERRSFACPWTMGQILLSMVGDVIFLVAVEGTAVLGYLSVACVLDEGHVGNVAVAPEHRRQGIAEALMLEAIEMGQKRKLSFFTLEVRVSNVSAIALYEKCGFTEVGLRRGYYYDPREDALLMTRFFNNGE